MMWKTVNVEAYQKGILFCNGNPVRLLEQGNHRFFDWKNRIVIRVFEERDPWLKTDELDIIIKSGIADDKLKVIDLRDHQRALVWIDKRFETILGPGLYALWNTAKNIEVEVLNIENPLFEHPALEAILNSSGPGNVATAALLEIFQVSEGHEGLFFLNGKLESVLKPGRYVFWKGAGRIKLYHKDMREAMVDINGQDIMTRDNVTLRLNAGVNYRIRDSLQVVLFSENIAQSLYREAQLALRGLIGTRDLDAFLAGKGEVEEALMREIRQRTGGMGIEILSLGIRDIILPGDMKELLNKVTEARKVAEANLISRREELAATRSQANTARILENNPVLMRLKELEVLEKITAHGKWNVVLGNEKLSEKVVNLL